MGVWYDFFFKNAYQQDANASEQEVRSKYPLLLHEKEKVELAFRDRAGKGRDKEYFTTHRILIKDGKGIGNKRKNYQSIPYHTIQAFQVDTKGLLDGDVSLQVWSTGVPYACIDFADSNVDIFEIQQYMNGKVVFRRRKTAEQEGTQDVVDPTPPNMDKKQTTAGNVIDWLGDNAKQVDPAEVENILKTTMPILLGDESVELSFKSGRDYTVFTKDRFLRMDVQGLGYKTAFTTVVWDSIHAYAVQTAGSFLDRDMEMTLYTNIIGMQHLSQDFRHGKADLFAIQKILCNHILGEDTVPFTDLDLHQGEVDHKGFWWFRDNQRPLDAVEINQVYHTNPPILRGNEQVEMAFKGHRDITLFTNLRVIIIDPKAITGKRVSYLTLPWKFIVAHAVRTAGKYLDWDAEVCFWTEQEFYPGRAGSDDSPPVDPLPLVSYFELDLNKNLVDLNAINYYLSRRLLLLSKMEPGAPIPMVGMTNQFDCPGGMERLLQWMLSDQRELDPAAINHELHTNTRILLDDEKVLMAFKAGRDTTLFTNLRVLTLDVQGLSGVKIQYTSIPFKSIRAWAVETAGVLDRDTELKLYTRNRWSLAKVSMDFRTGKADIAQINKFFSALIIGLPTDATVDFGQKNYESGKTVSNPISTSSMGLLFNSWEIDAQEMDRKLRTDPPLLLNEEKVLRAFQSGRDIDVYTNRRMIIIDTKGLSGKRVKYKSIPFKYITGYEFETTGHLDRDAEMYCYTTIANVVKELHPRVVPCLYTKQSLLTKNIDIYEIGKIFTDYVLFGENNEKYAKEPEIILIPNPEVEAEYSLTKPLV